MTDLKTCLKNINAGAPFPGRQEDFDTDEAWHHWRMLETSQLQQLMVVMIQFNPSLAKSTPVEVSGRPGSLYTPNERPHANAMRHASISSRQSYFSTNEEGVLGDLGGDDDDVLPIGHHFTFIPPNPRKFYMRLVELCLIADLEVMLSPEVDDNDEVSLGILSTAHLDLINECAVRWRIPHSYRAACFLDLVKQFYERNDVPLECIPEALSNVTKVIQETDLNLWPTQDVRCPSPCLKSN
jgi:hypothetical protein